MTESAGGKRYALIGTGSRAIFFYTALATTYSKTSSLVAFCDTNQTRLNYANSKLEGLGHKPVPVYLAADFDKMIAETKPDEVIVTTIDRTHNTYIVRALDLGCNVLSEKPMTIDAARCAEIFSAVERTGRRVRVAFNYRYAPHNTKISEVLRSGAIGAVTSVHFEWMLNTAHGSEAARADPFALHMEGNEQLKALYLDAEHEDGYHRDQSVFGDGINIEDTMSVLVRYRSGATLTYSLTAYAPWEGFRVSINGTQGRLEAEIVENSYVSASGAQGEEGKLESRTVTLRRLFEKPVELEIVDGAGAHGGGDEVLLGDLFGPQAEEGAQDDRAASHIDGAASILTGIAANRSIATGQVVKVDDVFQLP
ncbi:unnamed protein product [Clonostachys rosea f. rosea IK726]|uniref:Uncharacterized protein n=1 Tax=Clonostachys rosea f. rosea IK726 TaxID=1349383 RepID=A0ACA9TPV0_BIOOC|nr:unnamed protein product [Clonostachys rosea f. rosea IK726]